MATILLVEDEEKLARFVELELTHEGYRVDKAFDGRAGLEKAEPAVSVLPLLIIAAACLALFIAAELITHGGRAKRRRAA